MSTRTRSRGATCTPCPACSPASATSAGLDLPPLHGRGPQRQVRDRLLSRDFDAWSEALARVGNCAHPIRLHGRSQTVDTGTGEIVVDLQQQRGAARGHAMCGAATAAPASARPARGCTPADMFHLIRAGVTGGKTVPASVAENPLVFATVTAPSFGHVHGRRDDGRRCRPTPRRGRAVRTAARRTCHARHGEDDPALGQPLCPDCYDYASHVVWQWWAPDLWRRFTIALRRLVAKTLGVPATRLAEVATVQYAKVAEYQLRGVVHFHALVRLDGPSTADGFAPAPAAASTPACWPTWSQQAAALGPAHRARRRRPTTRPGCWRSAASSTPARCAPAAAPTTPTGR